MPLPERQIIERIRSFVGKFGQVPKTVLRGIGDDCAVLRLPQARELLVTTDFSLEGVHFHREWHPPDSVGHRCLARGLSDIAAMGGEPLAAFLSLAAPAKLPQSWIDGFFRGFLTLAKQFKVQLAGGDTAQSPDKVVADVILLGSVPTGKSVLRSGAHPGDFIYVSGRLGESFTTLNLLRKRKKLKAKAYPAHFYPSPRIDVGKWLRTRRIPSAMIDISDGLSTDLQHICDESRVGAVIYGQSVPAEDLSSALHGGEDYELAFTAPASKRVPNVVAGIPISRIGEIIFSSKPKLWLADANGVRKRLKPRGWEHFR